MNSPPSLWSGLIPNTGRIIVVVRIPADFAVPLFSTFLDHVNQHLIYVLPIDQGMLDEVGELHALLDRLPKSGLETVIISPSVSLFESAWSYSLLGKLYSLIREGGTMLLPLQSKPGSGYLTRTSIEKYFGIHGESVLEEKLIRLVKSDSLPRRPKSFQHSVLDWYWTNNPKILYNQKKNAQMYASLVSSTLVKIREAGMPHAPFLVDFHPDRTKNPLPTGGPTPLVATVRDHFQRPNKGSEALSSVNAQGYSVGGLRYKAAIISFILRKMFDGKCQLHATDVGGGYGTLAVELLLDETNSVNEVLVIDPSITYLIFAGYLFEDMRVLLNGRFQYELNTMQRCIFRPTDVVTFIGSLLFADRSQRQRILDGAWESLRPDGVLVVHENIKRESYRDVKEYKLMFDSDELTKLLSKYGDVIYFSSTEMSRVSQDRVNDLTVFRVVQKTH